MSTPVNKELRELRMAKEHYNRILKEDLKMKNSSDSIEGFLFLSDEDIAKINTKIDIINIKIGELLNKENDYSEVL